MELKQTKVDDQNRNQFYTQMYPQQFDSKQSLIDLDAIESSNIIAVDCCGWHYQAMFPQKKVVYVDPIKAALEFKLPKDKVFKFVDNRQDQQLTWPSLKIEDCSVIFDRSPLLKYYTLSQLVKTLTDVEKIYQPKFIVARLKLMFVDSARLTDRFHDIAAMQIENTIVDEFHYHANNDMLHVRFRKKIQL